MKTRQCRECGEEFQYDWNLAPFRWYCDEHLTVECRGEGCAIRLPRRGGAYCSVECRAPTYKERGKTLQVWGLCECGKSFHRYQGGSRRRYCSDECRAKYTHVGDRLRNDPEMARQIAKLPKPNHGLKGYKQSEEHLIKRLGNGSIRASKEELSLVPMMEKLGFTHTGEGTFWRRWPDGSMHNPDFVNEGTREIVEYFGAYWHADDRGCEDYIKAQWAAIGWDCRIIWSDEMAH